MQLHLAVAYELRSRATSKAEIGRVGIGTEGVHTASCNMGCYAAIRDENKGELRSLVDVRPAIWGRAGRGLLQVRDQTSGRRFSLKVRDACRRKCLFG